MDPLTSAAKAFMRDIEAFAAPAPGHVHAGPRVLRMVSAKGERTNVAKTLRWLEHQPENGSPVVLVDAKVEDARAYVRAIDDAVREGYAAVRAGLAEDGVAVPELPPARDEIDAQSLAGLLDRAANHLATVLDGLYVALLPEAHTQTASYRGVVLALARHTRSEALHLLAWDASDALHDLDLPRVDFAVDEQALWTHLEALGDAPSKGPSVGSPKPTPAQRAELAAAGISLPSGDMATSLRKLLLRASRALQEKQPRVAIRQLRAARALCHLDGLRGPEAVILVGLGTTYLHTRNTQGARASYRAAIIIAEAAGNTQVADAARRALSLPTLAREERA